MVENKCGLGRKCGASGTAHTGSSRPPAGGFSPCSAPGTLERADLSPEKEFLRSAGLGKGKTATAQGRHLPLEQRP